MEHRVLHMPVHCRAGMHESTRKSTRFPVSAPPSQDMCEVCLIEKRDARLAFVPCGTTGARVPHLPRFSYIYTSCAVSCAVNCVALIIYSLFNFICRILDILKTTGRTLCLHLKIDLDADLTPNITRHSCIISAQLVVNSFISNLVRLSSIVLFHIR